MNADPVQKLLLPYAEARLQVADGDLLLWRPTNLLGHAIAHRTGGAYSHVGSASWAKCVLESHDMLQWEGGRTRNLSTWVKLFSGKIDVYCFAGIDTFKMAQLQRRRAGQPYGWRDLGKNASQTLTHHAIRIPWAETLAEVSQREEPRRWGQLYRAAIDKPAFCSEGVASDLRGAGGVLYPTLAAREISPNMIAAVAAYQFTLVWE
jgi:hypothetical protein